MTTVFSCLSIFFAGLLTGAEATVTFGLRPALAAISDERAQIVFRQALIRSLRILVPSFYVPTAITGVAVAIWDANTFQLAGIATLLTWTLITFIGTVPINQAILTWKADAPPPGSRAMITRWHPLDMARTWAAAATFALFLAAMATRL